MTWTPRLALVAGFVIAADILLCVESPGLGLAVFAVSLGIALMFQFRKRLLRAGVWPVLWLLLAAGSAYDASILGKLLLLALGWAILAYATLPVCNSLFTALVWGSFGGLCSLGSGVADVRRYSRVHDWKIARRKLVRMPWTVHALPLVLIGFFAALLVPANLALAQWFQNAYAALLDFAGGYNLERFSFWLMSGVGIYGLFRFRGGKRADPPSAQEREPIPNEGTAELRAGLLTFCGLNALYLLTNVSDALYLWLNVALPKGISYADYAHHGSYRLIGAVVLAAVTVTAFFRLGAPGLANRASRALAYVFIAQNLVVLAGAFRRLALYIDVYGLTRFRVAAFLWMILVAAGFLFIVLKLAQRRPLGFLLHWNAITTVVLLSAVALADVDGAIADWNLARLDAGESRAIDLAYLAELGPGAIPALQRLSNRPDSIGSEATSILAFRFSQERGKNQRWQNWTWRRSKIFRD